MRRLINPHKQGILTQLFCASIYTLHLALGSADGAEPIVPDTARIDVSQVELGANGMVLYSKPFAGTYLKEGNSGRRINYRHGEHIAPRISPDGNKILWHSKQGGRLGIWLTDTSRETSERVCDGAHAAWSPDGTKLVLVRDGHILEKQLANGDERTVSPSDLTNCQFPSYLPDGRICFVRRAEPNDALYIFNRSGQVDLHHEAPIASAPRCSPDGRKIACQIGPHIWLFDFREMKWSQLTTAGGVQSWPIWSANGEGLAYCHGPARGPWDLHHVSIRSPRQVRQIQRNVWPAADWNGRGIPDTHQGEANQNAQERLETQWSTLSLDDQGGSITMQSRVEDVAQQVITISGRGSAAKWKIHPPSIVSGEIQAQYYSEDGDAGPSLNVSVLYTRPSIELLSRAPVFIETELPYVLQPNRFSNDLLVDPSKHSSSLVPLPWSPMVLGLLPGGQSALILLTPNHDQTVTVSIKDGRCSGLWVDGADVPFHVSLLTADRLWSQPEITFIDGSSSPTLQWAIPFAARWRASTFGSANYSITISEKPLTKIKPIGEFEGDVENAVVYLIQRSWNTPQDVLTPDDILHSAIGVKAAHQLLQLDAITGYRTTATSSIPLHELLLPTGSRYRAGQVGGTSGNWGVPWRKHLQKGLDISPLLEFLGGGDYGGIVMSDSPSVRSAVDHLCSDVVNVIPGLDNRRMEYAEYFSQITQLRDSQDPAILTGYVEILQQRSKLTSSDEEAKRTTISQVKEHIEQLKPLFGSNKPLGKEEEFERFCEVSLAAVSQRQSALRKCRRFLKVVRDKSARLLGDNPNSKEFVERVRQITATALGDRHYLEGDWRGEIPQAWLGDETE